ncbi:septum formation family protein [Saccharomonospora sp. NPDC046836]|uniref:septum formation family protein n=1 Tax=Saccharomonospora sp. NPDC046836 TaxID=3156921 RepID=UPI0033D2BFFE
MSDEPDRFPAAPKSALRTRVLVVGVFIGALVAMSFSWVFSWGFETEAERAEAAAEAALTKRREAFSSPPGSCLTWSASDANDVRAVRCAQDHLFEVVGVVDIAAEFPPGARQPSTERWRTITEQRCGEKAEQYLKAPLDPVGKLSLGVLRPDDEQWREGERTLHCGLQWAGPGGELQTLRGPAAEENQSNVWEPGTCLGIEGKTVSDPVDCSAAHSYEIVGLVDLKTHFEDGFPALDDQKTWLDTECSRVVSEYTGEADLREKGLILSWDLREQASWDAGATMVNCKVAAKLEDDSGLAPVRGSVEKQPDPPPTPEPDASQSAPTEPSAANGG